MISCRGRELSEYPKESSTRSQFRSAGLQQAVILPEFRETPYRAPESDVDRAATTDGTSTRRSTIWRRSWCGALTPTVAALTSN